MAAPRRVATNTLLGISRRIEFLLWLVLALAGQACLLSLIDAGSEVGYQHLRRFEFWARPDSLPAALILGVQTILVAAGCWFRIRRSVPLRIRWRWVAAFLCFALPAATFSRDFLFYLQELGLAAVLHAVQLGSLLLVASSLPEADWVNLWRKVEKLIQHPRLAIWAASWTLLVSAGLNVFIYERSPHVADEFAYWLHAHYFAEGLLQMPLPPVPEAFDVDLMAYTESSWYSPTPPGWPLALALGVALGAPWLVNPALAAISILLLYALGLSLFGRRTAGWSVILASSSPWFLFLAMSYMGHVFTVACVLLAALAAVKVRERSSLVWAIVGGASLGVSSWIRPMDGLVAAGLIGVWLLFGLHRRRAVALVALTLSAIAAGGAQLAYNRHFTGDPGYFPLNLYLDQNYGQGSNDLGFGPHIGLGWQLDPYPGHGWRDVLVNINLNSTTIDVDLLGWGCGSLALIWLLMFSGLARTGEIAAFGAIGAVVAAFSLYWFSGGPDFSARYWFLAFVPLIFLCARALVLTREYFHGRIPLAALAAIAGAILIFLPWRATDKYYRYLNVVPDLKYWHHEGRFDGGLVLVRGKRFPDYMPASLLNSVDIASGKTIYAWYRDEATGEQLRKAFPGRPVWIVDGPSITRAGYKVREAQSAQTDSPGE